jgi:hypothetical protein
MGGGEDILSDQGRTTLVPYSKIPLPDVPLKSLLNKLKTVQWRVCLLLNECTQPMLSKHTNGKQEFPKFKSKIRFQSS